MAKASNDALLERSFSLANEAMHTLALQHRRLEAKEPEDDKFVFRWWADLQFFIVALRRLRRAVELSGRLTDHGEEIRAVLDEFDEALPALRSMRDVGEHIDDYASDSSRRRHPVNRRQLQVEEWDGATLRWLDASLNVDDAMAAAEQLFAHLRTLLGRSTKRVNLGLVFSPSDEEVVDRRPDLRVRKPSD
jgi:hypothetical protein